MSDLQLSDQALDDLRFNLLMVTADFSEIDRVSRELEHAVGHSDLQAKVHDFAAKWDDRRRTIIELLDALGKATGAIASTFDEVDGKLSTALTSEGN